MAQNLITGSTTQGTEIQELPANQLTISEFTNGRTIHLKYLTLCICFSQLGPGNMYRSGQGMNLVVLDACRNNPYDRDFRSAEYGTGPDESTNRNIYWLCYRPGDVAADGSGNSGAFTKHLINTYDSLGFRLCLPQSDD